MTHRVTRLLGCLLLAGLQAGAAAPQESPASEGVIRIGSWLFHADPQGAFHLLLDDVPWMERIGPACGLKGYTDFTGFEKPSVSRSLGKVEARHSLPGGGVAFFQSAAREQGVIVLRLVRTGPWPKEADWCSLQLRLPVTGFSGKSFEADGTPGIFPKARGETRVLVSKVKRLELVPGSGVSIESTSPFAVRDARHFGTPAYQVDIPYPQRPRSEVTIRIRVPAERGPKPALRVSGIGYPVSGTKRAVLEWASGVPRPDDQVRIVDAEDKTVLEGRFGKTVSFRQKNYASFDFTKLQKDGRYRIRWSGGESELFPVGMGIVRDALWQPTLDVFLPAQMCHAAVDVAGVSHGACHLDDGIRVPGRFAGVDAFRSYECEGTPYRAGQPIPCAVGGWHDAGDYDLNVAAQAFTVWVLSLAREEFGVDRDVTTVAVKDRRVSGGRPDGIPDILQQIAWGARWLLAMQQEDGRFYVGVVAQPDRYGAKKLPERTTDNRADTGDERHVYVDYHAENQLSGAMALGAAARVLKAADKELSRSCLDAARRAFRYFEAHPEVYRNTAYFRKDARNRGRDGMVLAAAVELYLSTEEPGYLDRLKKMEKAVRDLPVEWPSPERTNHASFWYAPPSLARIAPRLPEGSLKDAVLSTCRRAAGVVAHRMNAEPWPMHDWAFHDWGNNRSCVSRIFDAYWLSRVSPKTVPLRKTIPSFLWLFGLHPLNDASFVYGVGRPQPRYLYNGLLVGRQGAKPGSIPGAVAPGIRVLDGAGILVFRDEHERYRNTEATIYTAALYLFSVHALKRAGF